MLMSGRNILAISGKGGDFPEIGPLPTFWPLSALDCQGIKGGVIFLVLQ